jgi:hypothetical protein
MNVFTDKARQGRGLKAEATTLGRKHYKLLNSSRTPNTFSKMVFTVEMISSLGGR